MKLDLQRKLAASVLKVGLDKVHLDPEKTKEIKEAITKADIRSLVKKGFIKRKPDVGSSKVRTRERHEQRKKGRRRGKGKRKGTANARAPKKRKWMNKVRVQRTLLKKLKETGKLSSEQFKKLYAMSKGGFFRSKSHLKLYLEKIGVFKK